MGRTAPNPSVAAVLAGRGARGEISLFSGGTEIAGGRHAEIVALDRYDQSGHRLTNATLFVTLEPCSRHGRTPPCTDRILKYTEITRVILYAEDPSLQRSGIHAIASSGRSVRLPLIHRNLQRNFNPHDAFLSGFTGRISGRGPRFHLKAATTCDGVMGVRGRRIKISGLHADRFSMMLRATCDAVLVGPGTIESDLPSLNVRLIDEGKGDHGFQFNTISGNDLFSYSLLKHLSRKERLVRESGSDYQPKRVFILGRRFEGDDRLIRMQSDLAKRSGREPIFLLLRSNRLEWSLPGYPVLLPDLDDPSFARELRGRLADMGLNDVMIEGGAGLFRAIGHDLQARDRIYTVRSKNRVMGHGDGQSLIRIPAELIGERKIAEYDLGEDLLEVRKIV